jgi:2-amino-4-hydroxy-6-hydroxymethyldihydropteridine diphosphokinase
VPGKTSNPSTIAVISIGSNLGDRHVLLQSCLDSFRADDYLNILGWGKIYESKPVGANLNGNFLNSVMVLDVACTPYELLNICHEIEARYGRERIFEENNNSRNRTLDCDIIFFGDYGLCCEMKEIKTKSLNIPHPEWRSRAFVVLPLMDIIDNLSAHQAKAVKEAFYEPLFNKFSCRLTEKMLN